MYHQRWLLGDEHAGRIVMTVSDTSLMDGLAARANMAEMILKQTGYSNKSMPPLHLMSESYDTSYDDSDDIWPVE